MSQGVECYSCLPKTAWPPTSQETFYQKVKVSDVPVLFSDSVLRGVPYRKQLYREDSLADPNAAMQDIPFYKKQKRVAQVGS